MSDMENTEAVEYKLSKPMKVAVKGDYVDLELVTLLAPTAASRSQAAIIKSFVGPLFKSFGGDASPEQMEAYRLKAEANKKAGIKDERMSGAEFANNASLKEFDVDKQIRAFDSFVELVTGGGRATIGGEKFTTTMFEKLSFHDSENMFYEYSLAFLLDSLLN